MGDFNAKVGQRGDEHSVGMHGTGNRKRTRRKTSRMVWDEQLYYRQHMFPTTTTKKMDMEKPRRQHKKPNRLHFDKWKMLEYTCDKIFTFGMTAVQSLYWTLYSMEI